MKLKNYVGKIGDSEAAVLFGVKERTTASWRRGERLPRPDMALRIVKATGGEVSFCECFDISIEEALQGAA